MKTYKLQNGITKVPAKSQVYKNKAKFNMSLNALIDTNVVYEEFDLNYKLLRRLDNHPENSYYGAYKFYPNGYFNYFIIDRDASLNENSFNPQYAGYRGVYYLKNVDIGYDLFSTVNQSGWLGKLTGVFFFRGDTLLVHGYQTKDTSIYIKRKLPGQLMNFNVDW